MNKVPKGWTRKKLREVLFEVGKRNKKLEVMKVLSVSNKHGLTNPENLFGRRIASDEISNYKIISKGQFAYNPSRLLVGSLAIKEGDGEAALSPLYVVFDTTNEIDKKYLLNWLFSEKTKQKFFGAVQGGVRDSVSYEALSELDIELPPLKEQAKIAQILSSVERVIELTSIEIDKLKDLKKGMMKDLFTKGIGHTKFKDSPVGKIPENWDTLPLAEIVLKDAPICYGVLMPGNHVAGGIPIVKVKNIKNNRIELDELLSCCPSIEEKYSRSRIKAGDLLITIRGSTGRLAFVPESLNNANITQDSARIRINDKLINPLYVFYCLLSPVCQKQIVDNTIGQAVKGINLEEVRKLIIPLPASKEEQTNIANSLDSINKRIFLLSRNLEQKKMLKKGLMNDLLTGKVRVKV